MSGVPVRRGGVERTIDQTPALPHGHCGRPEVRRWGPDTSQITFQDPGVTRDKREAICRRDREVRLLSTGVDELVGNVLWRFYKRLEVMEDIAPDPWVRDRGIRQKGCVRTPLPGLGDGG